MQIDTNRGRAPIEKRSTRVYHRFRYPFLYAGTFYDVSKYRLTSRCSNLRAASERVSWEKEDPHANSSKVGSARSCRAACIDWLAVHLPLCVSRGNPTRNVFQDKKDATKTHFPLKLCKLILSSSRQTHSCTINLSRFADVIHVLLHTLVSLVRNL